LSDPSDLSRWVSSMFKPRVLLIGWDAADWKVIRPLLHAGEMPNLARLMASGVHGNLATIYPPLSPMLWTSIATGKRAGVALNPHTGEDCLRYVLDQTDLVLVMSVNPGFGGQAFISAVLPKLERVRAMIDASGLAVDLEVDGGVKPGTAKQVIAAGADVLVAGSAVFGQGNYAAAIRALREDI